MKSICVFKDVIEQQTIFIIIAHMFFQSTHEYVKGQFFF